MSRGRGWGTYVVCSRPLPRGLSRQDGVPLDHDLFIAQLAHQLQEHAVCEFIALVALDARQEGAGGAGEVVAFLGRGEELLRGRVGVVDCVCADGGEGGGEGVFLEGVREGGLLGLEFGLRGLVEGGGEGGFVEGVG